MELHRHPITKEKTVKFRCQFQDTPFNYTRPEALLVEAESVAEAFATTYNHLTVNGKSVDSSLPKDHDTAANRAALVALGIPESNFSATRIREITPYTVQVHGKVL